MNTLPTYDALYAFLKAHYKHDRFEGRKPPEWAPGYSNDVTHSRMDELERNGFTFIGQYESVTGRAIKFDSSLTILETA